MFCFSVGPPLHMMHRHAFIGFPVLFTGGGWGIYASLDSRVTRNPAGTSDDLCWAGLHDNVPDRPSAKGAPVGCQLATMALKIKTVTIPKSGFATAEGVTQCGTSVHPSIMFVLISPSRLTGR